MARRARKGPKTLWDKVKDVDETFAQEVYGATDDNLRSRLATIAIQVTLDVPGLPEPAVGLINSLPERGEAILNRPYVRAGRLPLGRTTQPVLPHLLASVHRCSLPGSDAVTHA